MHVSLFLISISGRSSAGRHPIINPMLPLKSYSDYRQMLGQRLFVQSSVPLIGRRSAPTCTYIRPMPGGRTIKVIIGRLYTQLDRPRKGSFIMIRLMHLKLTVYCKFKKANEENIKNQKHTTSTLSIHRNVPTFGYFRFRGSPPRKRCGQVV